MKKSALVTTALGAAFAASMFAASPAMALEPKQCLPMAQMNDQLRSEGQRTLVLGNREALGQTAITEYANAVTSNADGSLGYQLEGDQPRSATSTSMCVAAKLTNIHLYDARKPGLNKAALLGGGFDEAVRDGESKGTRPMVVADTIRTAANGQVQHGSPLVVFGNIAGRSGSIFARMPNGSAQMLVLMGDVDYTPTALSRLNPELAMVTPK